MKSTKRFFTRLFHSATRRDKLDQEARIREEIAEHIALQTSDNLRAGLSPKPAARPSSNSAASNP